MKIQYLAIIFLIIIIPMTLLLTMYNQAQINNLSLQLTYNSYLSDATHNAVKAFELNTVNNSYSEVADSLKRDVEAAVNVFLSSMATNLGTSGATSEAISEYVPAILFTLYDGYYIYAPSYNEILGEKTIPTEAIDGTTQNVVVAVSKDQLEPPQKKEEDFTHILKPYVYYTMRYVGESSNTDFIVNYTLDNYISIYGKINGKYVTKSGYLVEITDTVSNTLSNGVTVEIDSEKLLAVLKRDLLSYYLTSNVVKNLDTIAEIENTFNNDVNFEDLKREINFGANGSYRVSLISDMGTELLDKMLEEKYNDIELYDIPVAKIDEVFSENGKNNIDDMDKVIDCFNVEYNGVAIEDEEAKSYYVKALQFSNWVNREIGDIEVQDAKDSKGQAIGDFAGNNGKLFRTTGSNNPEDTTSTFYQHKIEVIRDSIQSSLTSAIARYNQSFFGLKHGYDLKMPVLNDLEWEAITNNVTMVTFMQGMIIGNKVFNDYAVVSSDTNKEVVDEEEIYYFNRNSRGDVYYHKYDCPKLKDELNDPGANIIGFKSTEFEIHKEENEDSEDDERAVKYQLGDQLRRELFGTRPDEYGNEIINEAWDDFYLLADYECLVNRNYTPVDNSNNATLELARLTAIARERNLHYKINGYLDSNKIEYKSGNIVLSALPAEFTNQTVMVSIDTDMDDIVYYTDADTRIKDWPKDGNGDYEEVPIYDNTTIYAYSKINPEIKRSLPIENIDKYAPTIEIEAEVNDQKKIKITARASDNKDNDSGIDRYEFYVYDRDDPEHKPDEAIKEYTSNEIAYHTFDKAYNTTYECYVIVYDKAGNSTQSETITVTTNPRQR